MAPGRRRTRSSMKAAPIAAAEARGGANPSGTEELDAFDVPDIDQDAPIPRVSIDTQPKKKAKQPPKKRGRPPKPNPGLIGDGARGDGNRANGAAEALESLGIETEWKTITTAIEVSTRGSPALETEQIQQIEQLRAGLQLQVDKERKDGLSDGFFDHALVDDLCTKMNMLTLGLVQGADDRVCLIRDLYGNELIRLIKTARAFFVLYAPVMQDPQHLGKLQSASKLSAALTELVRNVRGPAKEQPEQIVSTMLGKAATIMHAFAAMTKTLREVISRLEVPTHEGEAGKAWAGHLGRLKEAEVRGRREREEQWLARHGRALGSVDSPGDPPRPPSPPHDTSLVQARRDRDSHLGEWTEEMDDELLQGLTTGVNRPLEQRYNTCLARPRLQNLMTEHIQDRALQLKPTLVAWYEGRNEAVPGWVSSISKL